MDRRVQRGAVAMVTLLVPCLVHGSNGAAQNGMANPIGFAEVLQLVAVLVAMGVVFLVIALAARRYTSLGSLAANRRIQLLESARISRRTLLALVQVDGRDFLMVENGESTRITPLSTHRNSRLASAETGTQAEPHGNRSVFP